MKHAAKFIVVLMGLPQISLYFLNHLYKNKSIHALIRAMLYNCINGVCIFMIW